MKSSLLLLTSILLLTLPLRAAPVQKSDEVTKQLEKLKSQSSSERRDAVEALGYADDKRAVEPLIQALKDSSADVRAAAANALSLYNDDRSVEPLVATL